MGYWARIIADTVSPCGARLTTFELSIPKWIQAEFNTHRMISRNSASSRAIPVKTMLKRIEDDPVMPVWWGKNQPGMSAREELEGEAKESAKFMWSGLRYVAMQAVSMLVEVGLHKQIANRLLEPWMFTTVIATGTEWENFFALRAHPDAQPEFQKVAAIMHDIWKKATPRVVENGDFSWHTPYVDLAEAEKLTLEGFTLKEILQISAGRCARVSYLTHDGRRDPRADIELCERLVKDGHMSPLEHVAKACTLTEWANLDVGRDWSIRRIPTGNFWGWRPLRKLVRGEHHFTGNHAWEEIRG